MVASTFAPDEHEVEMILQLPARSVTVAPRWRRAPLPRGGEPLGRPAALELRASICG